MSTSRRIGLADFEELLKQWVPIRRIDQFHLHCTDRPRRADFRGIATIEAMRTYHMKTNGWSDIAQHLTIDPAGGLWTGRSWDKAPASALGHNGSSRSGPFMIEVVGNFDTGKDPFNGPQRAAVLGVIVAVLKKFNLRENALFFHRDFTNAKTCPGTSLDKATLQAEIADLLDGRVSLELPAASDATLDASEVRAWFAQDGARGLEDESMTHPDLAEVPEADWMLAEQEALATRLDVHLDTRPVSRAPLPGDAPLRRHVINLSKGLLSKLGDIDSVTVTPRTIVEKHLVDYLELRKQQNRPAHLVLYAHGGLVDEASAICYAQTVLPWWLKHGVFPIFFIWESGLFETLRRTPRGVRLFGDVSDWLLEGLTQPVARRVWAEMKEDATNASRLALAQYDGRSGGAWQLAELVRPVLAKYPLTKIHAIGHSTGPILLAKFLPLLTDYGLKIDTLSYLAPAIRIDQFLADVVPRLGAAAEIRDLCIFTMTDEAERDDHCVGIYRKSLLYFVREACEDRDNGRILGLQRDMYGSTGMRNLFGLPDRNDGRISAKKGVASIEFSPAPDESAVNPKTSARRHGGFDNNGPTMVSVLERILGDRPIINSTDLQFPSEDQFRKCGFGESSRAAPLLADAGGTGGHCACCCCAKASATADPADDGHDGFGDDVESGAEVEPAQGASESSGRPTRNRRGRRVAVCVGINAYREQPLQGCVSDSRRWAEAFARHGFETRLLLDGQATGAQMHAALSRLVSEATAGDELVFQFSGHGAQLPDLNEDELDLLDEVFVPFDYHQGQMLIDDDVRTITRGLAEDATLTLFMDCCHSGTNSRVARPRTVARGALPRLMVFDQETVARYKSVRRNTGAGTPPKAARGGPGPGVAHFAACLDNEYAWESSGEGDFTAAALAVLDAAVRDRWSNGRFMQAVIGELGRDARQHPRLWQPATGLEARAFLGGS